MENLRYILPELILSFTVLVVLAAGMPEKRRCTFIPSLLTITGLAGSAIAVLSLYNLPESFVFSSMIAVDPYCLFFKILFAFTSIIIVLLSIGESNKSSEYYALLLLATIGMYTVSSAVDIVTIMLGLELISIPSYIMAGYWANRPVPSEVSIKYILFGALSTGILLYGFSLLYGISGNTNLYSIHQVLSYTRYYSPVLCIAFVFILAGIGYKIAFVPFHFWNPDVYEGSSVSAAAFLSGGPVAAGLALLIRFLLIVWAEPGVIPFDRWIPIGIPAWPLIIGIISVVTMTVGNIAAMHQRNIKRLMAYSTIAHIGYMLMGLAVTTGDGLKALFFYLVVFLIMNLGAFLVIEGMRRYLGAELVSDYRGLGYRVPFLSIALVIFLFSLGGMPPFSGFVGKFYLFAALVSQKVYWIAGAGILNCVFSLYYYIQIIRSMFFEKAQEPKQVRISRPFIVLVIMLLFPTFLFGIYWTPLIHWAEVSLNLLLLPQKLIGALY